MKRCGVHPVVVHGGGPQISPDAQPAEHRLGVPRRLAGDQPGGHGGRPDGAGRPGRSGPGRPDQPATAPWPSACPARTAACSPPTGGARVVDGEEVDLGLVGDVVAVRTEAVQGLIDAGRVPVVASIAPDLDGVVHNVNADTAAAALAVALQAERLVVLTDVEGLYRDWPNSTEIISELSASELRGPDAQPGVRHGAQDGGLPARGRGRADPGHGDRRPGAARAAAGDLHQRRDRHHGHPGRAGPAGQPGVLRHEPHPAARVRQRRVPEVRS